MKLTLTSRMLATLIPIVAACLLGTGSLAIRGAEAVVDRFASRYGRDIAEGERSKIQTYFERNARAADILAQAAAGMIETGRTDRVVMAELVRRTATANDQILGVWFYAEPDTFGLDSEYLDAGPALGDPTTGRFLTYFARHKGESGFEPAFPDYATDIYYAEPRRLGRPFVTPPYNYPLFGEQLLISSYTVPVIVGERFVGVAGVDFELASVARHLATLNPLGGSVRLVTDDQVWIHAPDLSVIGTARDSTTDPLSRLSATERTAVMALKPYERDITVDGAGGPGVYRRIAMPLRYFPDEPRARMLILDLPLTELKRPFAAIRTTILVASTFAAMVVAIVLAVSVRAFVGRPLEQVQRSIRRLEESDFDSPVPMLQTSDVIGDVARALEGFRRSLVERSSLQRSLTERTAEMQRLVAAIEAAQDGIVIFDARFRVEYANAATLRMLNAPDRSAVIGRRWRTLIDPATQERLDRLEPTLPNSLHEVGHWVGVVYDWRTIFGARVEAMEGRATLLQDGTILMAFQDVTAAHRAERERQQMESRLAHQQKMEAVGRLAGGIAHDFNNLLGAIMGYLEFLVADLPAASPQRTYAERAAKVADRAKEMIRHILSFSRPGGSDIASVAPAAILAEVRALLVPTLPATMKLSVEAAGELPPVAANATQIVQVLMNLAINARDACRDDRGAVEIRAEALPCPVPGTEDWPCHPAIEAAPGEQVCFVVRDDGQGIPPDVLPRIFEPFFSTKDAKGTGLGLATVYGIVKAHGGGLEVRSRVGTGTVFRVLLPVRHAVSDAPEAEHRAACPTALGGRVLVVDDETEMGDMLEEGLGRLGFEVAVCETAEEALEVFEEEPLAFDAVVTDQTMPGAPGMTLIGRLKRLRPDLPCILYTGYSDRLDEGAALEGGADAYFAKPVRVHDLATELARLIARPRP